jgi:Papain family cysteine protease
MKWSAISRIFVLAILLGACNEVQPPTQDPFFTGLTPSAPSVPADAQVVTPEEFKQLVQTEGLKVTNPAQAAALVAGNEAQFKADEAEVKLLAQTDPRLLKILNPDPSIPKTGDGDYVLTIQGKSGPFEVITDGPRRMYRRVLESRARFNNAANQLRVYRLGYDTLPENLKTGLATPDSLLTSPLATILEARKALTVRLNEHPEALEDEQAIVASTKNVRAVNPNAKPSNFPASPDDEEGKGKGIDREGASKCGFDSYSPNGLYQNFWWKQKFYHTSVKSQGGRGSCVGFAVTAALEGKIAIEKSRYVNLSEQYFWAKIAGEWDEREYGDGANTADTADEFLDTGFKLPFESVWNYNIARSRVDHGDDEFFKKPGDTPENEGDYYTKSCEGYTEHCSNTSHQRKKVCTTYGTSTFCAYQTPAISGERFGATNHDNIYDWTSWSLPVQEMRTLLKNGQTLTAGFVVNTGFDNPTDGFITTLNDNDVRGGHAVQIVGFISANSIKNHPTISSTVKNHAQNSGGGYFILKNSWGYCDGDAGYIYVPITWAEEFFHTVEVFSVKPSEQFKKVPNISPTLSITAPSNGLEFPFRQKITLQANAVDPDSSTPPTVTWSSDIDGLLGTGAQLEVSFNTPGTRKIMAVAADGNGGYSDGVSISITGINQPPVATIQLPLASTTIYKGIATVLQGNGSDNDTGNGFPSDLPCSSLTWTSNIEGNLGTGCDLEATFNTLGTRTLTLTATDANGGIGSTTRVINVQAVPLQGPPIVNILKPTQNQSVIPTNKLFVSYTAKDPDNGSPLTYQWLIRYSSNSQVVEKTVTTKFDPLLLKPYFIPADYVPANCGGRAAELELKVTDPQGETGSDKVGIYVYYPVC